MKNGIVRFVVLLVFNILVLLVIGWFTPAHVGWSALWAGIVLTLLTMFVKPLLTRWIGGRAAKTAGQRTRAGNGLAQAGVVLLIAAIVWIVTVLVSGVRAGLNPLAYILPPIILAAGWWVYDLIAGRVESHAGALYDKATGAGGSVAGTATPPIASSPEAAAGRRELQDGLTDEQRRMLDDLG
ncbi:phage holin family protein [Microbacterium sp. BWT-B31]|uniref:phage holin family protein n=1 Tax=Microbacterium sp. BWT-B31 TaxID=3232072 RepID=UPI003527BC57